jgi:hypothetical protein
MDATIAMRYSGGIPAGACVNQAVRELLEYKIGAMQIRPILNKSAYEWSGVSRGADPASNGPFQSGGDI